MKRKSQQPQYQQNYRYSPKHTQLYIKHRYMLNQLILFAPKLLSHERIDVRALNHQNPSAFTGRSPILLIAPFPLFHLIPGAPVCFTPGFTPAFGA